MIFFAFKIKHLYWEKKMIRKLLTTLLVFAIFAPAFAQTTPFNKPLPFKEATISYKISGTERGTQTVYIKDSGKTIAKHKKTVMKIMGMKQETNSFTLITPEWNYTADLKKRTGSKVTNQQKFMIEEFNKLSAADKAKATANAEKLGVNLMQGMGGKIQKNAAKIKGYNCDKITIMGVNTYVMSDTNIEMKSNSSMMGIKMNLEVTDIKKGGKFPANAFKLPAGINFVHNKQAEAMSRQMAKSMIQGLVSGQMPQAQIPNMTSQQGNQSEDKSSNTPKMPKIKMPNLKKMFKF